MLIVFKVIAIKLSFGVIFDCLVCGGTGFSVSHQMLPHLTRPEEKMQEPQELSSGESLSKTDKAVIDCQLWLFKQRVVNLTIDLMADSRLRCTPELQRTAVGGRAACGRGINTLLRKLGPSLTCPVQHGRVDFRPRRLCTETLCVRARRVLACSARQALRYWNSLSRHIISGRICIIPHHAAAGQDKHARRQTSNEKPPPAGSNLAFLQLPLHSDDWQNQLRPRRLTLHHLRWFVFSSEGTRALQWMSDLTPSPQTAVGRATSAAVHLLHSPGVYHLLSLQSF